MGYSFFLHSLTGTIFKAKILTNINKIEELEIRIYTFLIPQNHKKISIHVFLINAKMICQTIFSWQMRQIIGTYWIMIFKKKKLHTLCRFPCVHYVKHSFLTMWMGTFVFLSHYNLWHKYLKGYVLAIISGWFKTISSSIPGKVNSTQMSWWEEGGDIYQKKREKTLAF